MTQFYGAKRIPTHRPGYSAKIECKSPTETSQVPQHQKQTKHIQAWGIVEIIEDTVIDTVARICVGILWPQRQGEEPRFVSHTHF